jgi:hypothetical protein
MRSAFGQRVLLEAAQHRMMMKAAKASPVRERQHVQKPGISGGKSRSAQSMEALEARLAATGSEADGWNLLQARMNRRG